MSYYGRHTLSSLSYIAYQNDKQDKNNAKIAEKSIRTAVKFNYRTNIV